MFTELHAIASESSYSNGEFPCFIGMPTHIDKHCLICVCTIKQSKSKGNNKLIRIDVQL